MQNILINGITLDTANIFPLLKSVKYWQSKKNKITFIGNQKFKKNILKIKIIKNFNFIKINENSKINTKLQLINISIKRNFLAIFKIKLIKKNKYQIVYSRSSVLDLVILPYILKILDKDIKWATVFDNTVPITDSGNKIIRFLAWIFFQISLILLKKADIIFVISKDLKKNLIKKGFSSEKIVLTGNAIDNEFVKKAKKSKKYNIDALFIGRINETKGIFDMLKVLKIIIKTYPKFQLAIMGEGDKTTEKKFLKKIKQLQLTKNVQFLGYKTGIEKFNIIKNSKCFWFFSTSQSESFGIALMEAVCSGLPAFTYNLKPFIKIYKNNEIDMSPKGNYKLIAKKTIDLFNKKNFENKNGKKLLGKYNWNKIAKKEYCTFKKLLQF